MYILNAEIEDKKTLDTLQDMLKLLGIKPNSFKLEEYYDDIALSRDQIKKGKFSSLDIIKKKLK
jgi:transposase